MKNLRRVFEKVSLAFSRLHVGYLGWLYFIHLKIRYLHDTTYAKGGVYKKWTDKPYSRAVHRTVLVSFVVSFIVLSSAQGLFPYLFNLGKPREVQSASLTKTWTTKNDFTSNAVTGGTAGADATWDTADDTIRTNRSNAGFYGDNDANDANNNDYLGLTFTGYNKLYNQGTNQSFVVPSDVTQVTIQVFGAGGGGGEGAIGNYSNPYYGANGNGAGNSFVSYGSSQYGATGGGGGPGACDDNDQCGPPGNGANGTYYIVSANGFTLVDYGPWGAAGGAGGAAGYMGYDGGIGGKGGYIKGLLGVTPGTTVLVTAAAGGTPAGTSWPGSPGTAGYVLITYNSSYPVAGSVPIYTSPALLGSASTTNVTGNIGLRFDAGNGANAKATSLTWNAETGSAGQKVYFKLRAGDTQAELDSSLCYGPSTTSTAANCYSDWSTAGSYFYQINGQSNSSTSVVSSIPGKKYTEVIVRLEASSSSATPKLNSVTLTYNALTAPTNNKFFNAAGTTEITNGWTNETGVTLKADLGAPIPSSSPLTPQIEIRTADSGWTGTAEAPAGVTVTPSSVTYTCTVNPCTALTAQTVANVTGLQPGTYYYRTRVSDANSRTSSWSNSSVVLNVERTLPTVGTITLKSSDGNSTYVNANNRVLTINSIYNDGGGSSPTGTGQLKVQFSQDAVNWGAYSGSGTTNSKTTDWTNFKTVTALGTAQDITGAWYLEGNSGTQTVYVRVKDAAGNIGIGNPNATKYGLGGDTGKTAPGTYSYTIPAGATTLYIDLKGAGGGGSATNPGGTGCVVAVGVTGGNSSITYPAGTTYSAVGGTGGGGFASCDPGASGGVNYPAGFVNSGQASGGGSAGGTVSPYIDPMFEDAAVGGPGGWLAGSISVTPAANVNVVVGAGGAGGGTGTGQGGTGGDGSVYLTYYVLYNDTISLDADAPSIAAGTITSPNSTTNKNWKGGVARNITWTTGNITDFVNINQISTSSVPPVDGELANGLCETAITDSQANLVKINSLEYDTNYPINVKIGGVYYTLEQASSWISGNSIQFCSTTDYIKINSGVVGFGSNGSSGLKTNPVTLSYSTNNGGTWTQIATNEANDGTYSWTPLNTIDALQAKIRLTVTDNAGNTTTQDSETFIIDSSVPTGSVSAMNARYNTSTINVPYTASDDKLYQNIISPGPSDSYDDSEECSGDFSGMTATASDSVATQVQVTWTWFANRGANYNFPAAAALYVNGAVVSNKPSLGYPTYAASGTETTGWLNGNSVYGYYVAGSCGQGSVTLNSVTFRSTTPLSGVDYTNLYYTRQTSAPYTWTKYNGDFDFTISPGNISFDSTAIGNGAYGFKLRAFDNAGNATAIPISSTAPDATTFIDTVAPTVNASNITNISPNPNNTGNQTVTWGTFADASPSSGFQKYVIQRKNGVAGTWTNIRTETNQATLSYTDNAALSDGTYYYRTVSYDNANNTTTSADSAAHVVDRVIPSMLWNTLETPNDATSWTGGVLQNIVWNAASITDNVGGSGLKGGGSQAISLYYANASSLDGNTVWTEIATLQNNGDNTDCDVPDGKGCYRWRPPNIQSEFMWVKIIAYDNAGNPASIVGLPTQNYDTNDSPFTLEEDNTAPVFADVSTMSVAPHYLGGAINYTTPATTLNWQAPTDSGSGVAQLELWVKQIGIDSNFRLLSGTNLTPASTSYPGTFAEGQWQWKLKAIDGIGVLGVAGHETFSPAYSMTTDGTPPSGTLSIAPYLINGYTATNFKEVNLTATATDALSGYSLIAFSNSPTGPWATYQVGLTRSWDISDSFYGGTTTRGNKTVYAKLKDNIGNESVPVSATIVWDDTVPGHPSNIAFSNTSNAASAYSGGTWNGNSSTRITWSAAVDSANPLSSGLHHYAVYRAMDSNNPVNSSSLGTTTNLYWDDSNLKDGHTYYYWIQAFDNALNVTIYQESAPGSLSFADVTNPEPTQNFVAVGISDSTIRISFNSAPDNSTTHAGKADRYVIDRTVAFWTTEPMGAPSSYEYLSNRANIAYEQSPYYKGSELYEYDDTVTSGQWYYYRAIAYDSNNLVSSYSYYKARGNFAPVFTQDDISLTVNNGHDQNSVIPGDTITVNFKVTDTDGRADLDTGNAMQQLKITDGSGAEVLSYTQVADKQNYSANSLDGYSYTHTYTLPTGADYGTYVVTINVKDSVAIGTPGTNSHNQIKTVQFKVPPAVPGNASASGYSSTQVQLDWDAPANGGLRATNTYEVERKPATGGNFVVVGTTTNTDYRDGSLVPNTAYIYRVRAFDVSGNGGTYTSELSTATPTPAIPSADTVELKDASTLSSGAYRILLLWGIPVAESGTTVNAINKYEVWRSENSPEGPFFQLSGENTETNRNYIVDTGLNPTTDYTYCIRSKDTFGNLSTNVDGTPLCRKITGRPGATPSIYAVGATARTSTAEVVWKVSGQQASSQVVYSLNRDQLMDETAAVSSAGIGGMVNADAEHKVEIKGLEPGKTYYYKVVTRNVLGIANTYSNVSQIPSFNTNNFVIQHDSGSANLEGANGGVVTTTENAEISWRTGNVPSDSFVEYYIENAPGASQIKGSGQIIPENGLHKILIPDLRANTTYVYYIKSKEENGLYTVTSQLYKFQTKAFDSSQFTIAPSASEVAEQNITATSAKIVWNTAIPTIGCVEYDTAPIGDRAKYPDTSCDAQYNTVHVIELMNLTPGETYYYRVTGTDISEATYFSKEYSFAAILQPEIQNLKANITSPYTAKITFNTNVDTDAVVTYGKAGDLSLKAGQTILSKEHEIELKDLEDGASYSFFVEVKDRSNSVKKSGENNFTTPIDTAGPKITGVKIELLPMGESDTTASVIISWQTDKPSTTKVEYTEGMVGATYDKATVEDETLNNSHTVIIKELEPSSTYRFRIVSKNKRGNESKSQDYNFVTPTKEKSIWQLIVKSLEETFSWVKNVGGFFRGQKNRAN